MTIELPGWFFLSHRRRPDIENFHRACQLLNAAHWQGCATNVRMMFPDIKSFLDVGCGAAMLVRALRQGGLHNVCGIDADPDIVAWNKHMGFPVEQALAWDLPWKDREHIFDLLYSFQFLEHIPVDLLGATLREFDRIAKYFICQTIGMPENWEPGILDTSADAWKDRTLGTGHFINQRRGWWLQKVKEYLPNWELFTPERYMAPWESQYTEANIFLRRIEE